MEFIHQASSESIPLPEADAYEIEQALKRFHPERAVFEIRIPGDQTVVGYFNDRGVAAQEIARFDSTNHPKAIYTTLQRLGPEATQRCTNRLGVGSSTKDDEIAGYQWILIDLDPERPKHTSSTDEELRAAEEKAAQIRGWLAERGIPKLLEVISGNGRHLYVPVCLPVEEKELVKGFLKGLHRMFSDDQIKVDTTVSNPSRITKIAGTVARKGVHSEERPHRRAQLLNPEVEIELVPRDLLAKVVEELTPPQPERTPAAVNSGINLSLPQLKPIREGCAFIEHCHTNASNLSEGEWFAGLSIVVRCEDGDRLGHEMSSPYPGYSPTETEKKIQHVLQGPGPRTCQSVEDDLGFEGCKTCPNSGKIGSPIRLGYELLVLSKATPLDSARELLAREFVTNGTPTLRHHNDEYLRWDRRKYARLENNGVRRVLYDFLDEALVISPYQGDDEPPFIPFCPNQNSVNQVLDALQAQSYLPNTVNAPAWLSESEKHPPADQILICRNGLVNIETGEISSHTPNLFATWALDVDYQPEAPSPELWLSFLEDQWGDDPESIDLLQQWFGYVLGGDTSHQKMLMIYGPRRSGKGTIGHVLTQLIGKEHVTGPQLSGLAQNFGLQTFIRSKLAIFPDARLSRRVDQAFIIERILAITGEDPIEVDRKGIEHWFGLLPTRLMILTNELPMFLESSGALNSRMLLLRTTTSFEKRPDTQLKKKLLAELPGILNWAMRGWQSLREAQQFIEPRSASDLRAQFEEQLSPVTAFIRDRCTIGPDYQTPRKEIFDAWTNYCQENGVEHAGHMTTLLQRLQSVEPSIRESQPWIDGKKTRVWSGIAVGTAPWNSWNSRNSVPAIVTEIENRERDRDNRSQGDNAQNSVPTVPSVPPGSGDSPSQPHAGINASENRQEVIDKLNQLRKECARKDVVPSKPDPESQARALAALKRLREGILQQD